MQNVSVPVFPASVVGISSEKTSSSGKFFSILSISLFLFLITFWIAISPVHATRAISLVVGFGSMTVLLIGAILGIIGIVTRKEPDRTSTLVIGIIGLCLNGLCLIGMILLVVAATIATVIHLHRDEPAAAASLQPVAFSSEEVYQQTNVTLVQNNLHVRVSPPSVVVAASPWRIHAPPRTVFFGNATPPPHFAPLQPMSPIFRARAPGMLAPNLMAGRHF